MSCAFELQDCASTCKRKRYKRYISNQMSKVTGIQTTLLCVDYASTWKSKHTSQDGVLSIAACPWLVR